jgi:hypothetical protein
VVVVEPADGAVAVPDDATVRVVFDEPVVIDSLAAPAIRVRGPAGEIGGAVRLDSTAIMLTFRPSSPLAVPAEFEVVLAAGIADHSGNARPDSLVVRFTTAFSFHDIGRIFTANELSQDLTVIDVMTDEPVPESPVPLGVRPQRLHGVTETGELYVLYRTNLEAGIRVLDARSLAELRDTGPVLDFDIADFIVSPDDGLVIVASPVENALLVLHAATLAPARPPLEFRRANSQPSRFAICQRFHWLLVGLDGGAQLDAYRLPSFDQVDGFPALAVEAIHTIQVDEERSRAFVGGNQRYAIADLINPSRSFSLQMEQAQSTQLWRLILSPTRDRVFFLYRRQSVASIVLSTLETAPESPGGLRINYYLTDIIEHPRSGELIILGYRSLDTPVYRIDARTLQQIDSGSYYEVGDSAVDMELMP